MDTKDKKTIKATMHAKHRQRMRKRIENCGLSSLAAHEILEYFLYFVVPQRDTNPIAHELIAKFGSLSEVLDSKIEDLIQINYIGYNAALFLTNLKDISTIYMTEKEREKVTLLTRKDVIKYVSARVSAQTRYINVEEVYCVLINHRSELLKFEKIASGTENYCDIKLNDIAELIVRYKPQHFLLIHNHPSNCLTPSTSDIELTKSVFDMLTLMQVNFVDHLILTKNGDCFSFCEHGLIPYVK